MQTMESPIQQYLDELLTDVAQLREGTPYLVHPPGREPDPDAFGICLATVDGHVYTSGDADREFSIHSISKSFSYALALEDDQDFFVQYQGSMTLRQETLDEYPEIAEIMAPISEKLPNEVMMELNGQVDTLVESPEDPRGQARDEEIGHRRMHQGGVEGLQSGHDLRGGLDRVLRGVDELAVVRAAVLGHAPRGAQVAAAVQAHRERRERAPLGSRVTCRDRGDDARVDAAGQEDAHRLAARHAALDGANEGLAHRVEHPLRRVLVRCAALQQHRRGARELTERLEPFVRCPDVSGRERLDERTQGDVERGHLGGEDDRVIRPDPVERCESQDVACDCEAALLISDGLSSMRDPMRASSFP